MRKQQQHRYRKKKAFRSLFFVQSRNLALLSFPPKLIIVQRPIVRGTLIITAHKAADQHGAHEASLRLKHPQPRLKKKDRKREREGGATMTRGREAFICIYTKASVYALNKTVKTKNKKYREKSRKKKDALWSTE